MKTIQAAIFLLSGGGEFPADPQSMKHSSEDASRIGHLFFAAPLALGIVPAWPDLLIKNQKLKKRKAA
jgi:hypothetical protein